MKIGEIGENFEDVTGVEYIDYTESITLQEYDLIVVDLGYMCSKSITVGDLEQRKLEFIEYIEYKKIPIVVMLTGTGVKQIYNKMYSLHDMLPCGQIDIIQKSGSQLNVINNTLFSDFFKKYKAAFKYTHYIESNTDINTPLAKSNHTNKVLATCSEDVVFIPELANDEYSDFYYDDEEFLKDLYSAVKNIHGDDIISLPKWSEKYMLPGEEKIVNDLIKIEIEIKKSQKLLEAGQSDLQKLQSKKSLFTSSGNVLEKEVENVFRYLGFNILKAEANRDDLIVEYNEMVAVVEIKGVSGSAAEKHAAQLEKWSANYIEERGTQPKGILLVNAFKDKELSKRGEVYPHQMLKYSTIREHCLMSTTQLLGLYYEVVNYPEKKEELIQSLFDTIGVYQGFTDWTKFIEQ